MYNVGTWIIRHIDKIDGTTAYTYLLSSQVSKNNNFNFDVYYIPQEQKCITQELKINWFNIPF